MPILDESGLNHVERARILRPSPSSIVADLLEMGAYAWRRVIDIATKELKNAGATEVFSVPIFAEPLGEVSRNLDQVAITYAGGVRLKRGLVFSTINAKSVSVSNSFLYANEGWFYTEGCSPRIVSGIEPLFDGEALSWNIAGAKYSTSESKHKESLDSASQLILSFLTRQLGIDCQIRVSADARVFALRAEPTLTLAAVTSVAKREAVFQIYGDCILPLAFGRGHDFSIGSASSFHSHFSKYQVSVFEVDRYREQVLPVIDEICLRLTKVGISYYRGTEVRGGGGAKIRESDLMGIPLKMSIGANELREGRVFIETLSGEVLRIPMEPNSIVAAIREWQKEEY